MAFLDIDPPDPEDPEPVTTARDRTRTQSGQRELQEGRGADDMMTGLMGSVAGDIAALPSRAEQATEDLGRTLHMGLQHGEVAPMSPEENRNALFSMLDAGDILSLGAAGGMATAGRKMAKEAAEEGAEQAGRDATEQAWRDFARRSDVIDDPERTQDAFSQSGTPRPPFSETTLTDATAQEARAELGSTIRSGQNFERRWVGFSDDNPNPTELRVEGTGPSLDDDVTRAGEREVPSLTDESVSEDLSSTSEALDFVDPEEEPVSSAGALEVLGRVRKQLSEGKEPITIRSMALNTKEVEEDRGEALDLFRTILDETEGVEAQMGPFSLSKESAPFEAAMLTRRNQQALRKGKGLQFEFREPPSGKRVQIDEFNDFGVEGAADKSTEQLKNYYNQLIDQGFFGNDVAQSVRELRDELKPGEYIRFGYDKNFGIAPLGIAAGAAASQSNSQDS